MPRKPNKNKQKSGTNNSKPTNVTDTVEQQKEVITTVSASEGATQESAQEKPILQNLTENSPETAATKVKEETKPEAENKSPEIGNDDESTQTLKKKRIRNKKNKNQINENNEEEIKVETIETESPKQVNPEKTGNKNNKKQNQQAKSNITPPSAVISNIQTPEQTNTNKKKNKKKNKGQNQEVQPAIETETVQSSEVLPSVDNDEKESEVQPDQNTGTAKKRNRNKKNKNKVNQNEELSKEITSEEPTTPSIEDHKNETKTNIVEIETKAEEPKNSKNNKKQKGKIVEEKKELAETVKSDSDVIIEAQVESKNVTELPGKNNPVGKGKNKQQNKKENKAKSQEPSTLATVKDINIEENVSPILESTSVKDGEPIVLAKAKPEPTEKVEDKKKSKGKPQSKPESPKEENKVEEQTAVVEESKPPSTVPTTNVDDVKVAVSEASECETAKEVDKKKNKSKSQSKSDNSTKEAAEAEPKLEKEIVIAEANKAEVTVSVIQEETEIKEQTLLVEEPKLKSTVPTTNVNTVEVDEPVANKSETVKEVDKKKNKSKSQSKSDNSTKEPAETEPNPEKETVIAEAIKAEVVVPVIQEETSLLPQNIKTNEEEQVPAVAADDTAKKVEDKNKSKNKSKTKPDNSKNQAPKEETKLEEKPAVVAVLASEKIEDKTNPKDETQPNDSKSKNDALFKGDLKPEESQIVEKKTDSKEEIHSPKVEVLPKIESDPKSKPVPTNPIVKSIPEAEVKEVVIEKQETKSVQEATQGCPEKEEIQEIVNESKIQAESKPTAQTPLAEIKLEQRVEAGITFSQIVADNVKPKPDVDTPTEAKKEPEVPAKENEKTPAPIVAETKPEIESKPAIVTPPIKKIVPIVKKVEERKLCIQPIPDPIADFKKSPSPLVTPPISPKREFDVKLVPELIQKNAAPPPPIRSSTANKETEKQLLSEALSELIDAAGTVENVEVAKIPPTPEQDKKMEFSVITKSTVDSIGDESMKTSKSKNEEGSDFVLSANTAATKSLDCTKQNEQPTSTSPTENKRNKDEANLQQSVDVTEKKLHELPEKTPQEKTDGVKFEPIKLLDILDAVMIASPEQKLALKKASEKLSESKNNEDQQQQQQTNVKNNAGTKPKTQDEVNDKNEKTNNNNNKQGGNTSQRQKKPDIPPKPEHLNNNNNKKNQKQQNQSKQPQPKKPDIPPKPGKEKIPPIQQKPTTPNEITSDSKNLKAVPTQDKSWNEATQKLNSKSDSKNLKSVPTPQTEKSWNTKQPIQILPEDMKLPPNIAEMLALLEQARGDCKNSKPSTLPLSSRTITTQELIDDGIDDDEEYVEYKFIPRQVFLASNCLVCQMALHNLTICSNCHLVSYCSEKHAHHDLSSHKPLCNAIHEIAKKRGGHVYNNSKTLSDEEFRTLRVHTMTLCQTSLQRPLQPFEREILLFPRMCSKPTCREWHQDVLSNCEKCHQASYCSSAPNHLPESHKKWCKYFELYKEIVIQQKKYGRIEPMMPSKILQNVYSLPKSIDLVFHDLYTNFDDELKDECGYAMLTQLATAPLTALYASQRCQQNIGDIFTIHLVGAEIQFEADTLDKWEAFFLHLIPNLIELNIVFIGPELNSENLPLDILSRIRMCRTCRQSCRAVRFDFQCGKLYHSYCKTSCFTKPDLICFFNPGLHRSTGFKELDTWPETIAAATLQNCPIIVTSYTEVESPKDFERLTQESRRKLNVVQLPELNPFTSSRPERNFLSDEIAPMIFKNFYCFIVT